jgi:hypothetical protein
MSATGLTVAVLLGIAALAGGAQQGVSKSDPKADKLLRDMSNYLGGLKEFRFVAEEFFDSVQDDGQKIQLSNHRTLSVRRPDKLFAESEGDTSNTRFYYDGKKVAVVDLGHKTYAVEKVTGTIDAMLDDLHERFGINAPLADFLFTDPYKVLTENVQSGIYVGLHQVGKTKCHHLAFRQKLLDWQIWIDAGEHPLPRKLVITFKRQAGEPQYSALIHRWDVRPELTDATFRFQPPTGVRKVDFLHRHGEPTTKKKRSG